MIKVIINCRFLTQNITGVQRYAIEITKKLLDANDDVTYTCVSPHGIIYNDLADLFNVNIIGRLSGHAWEQIELPNFLKSIDNPLLLNLANTAPLFYSNNIITLHDLAFFVNKKWFSFLFRTYYKILVPRIAKKAKHVLTVSNFSKSEIIKYLNIPESIITVTYNGLEHLEKNKIHNSKENYFLVVGSLDPRKNLQRTIKAFNELHFELKIVGGVSKSFNNENYNYSDNIEFLGRVTDSELTELYARAKGFIYLSLYEGFGIPPLEALTYGTRSIVSDIEVFHEILGDMAIFCNPKSVFDIKSTIERYAKNVDEKYVSEAETEELRKLYSWKNSSMIINRLLKHIK